MVGKTIAVSDNKFAETSILQQINKKQLMFTMDKNYEGYQQMTNLEQINYLYWKGCYGNNNQRVGYWMATWDGETLTNVGMHYNDDGRKEGNQVEIVSTVCTLCIIFEYQILQLKFMKQESMRMAQEREDGSMSNQIKEIGGGEYCQQGEKKGLWKELQKGFQNCTQFFIMGRTGVVRNLVNGILAGSALFIISQMVANHMMKKEMLFKQVLRSSCKMNLMLILKQLIMANIKIGKSWQMGYYVQGAFKLMQVFYVSTFYLAGVDPMMNQAKGLKQVNGLSYFMDFIIIAKSHTGCSIKVENQLVVGIFCLGMIRFIHFNQQVDHIIQYVRDLNHQFEMIGGGSFIDNCNQIKQGSWIEFSDDFQNDSSVIFDGQYQNGKKVGRWDILFLDFRGKKSFLIGGGSFNKHEFPLKQGKWIELSEGFQNAFQLTFIGDYQNGKKVGRWNIMYRVDSSYRFKLIGGDHMAINVLDKARSMDRTLESTQIFVDIINYGEFNNGIKVGRWNIYYKNIFKNQVNFIGGGSYDKGGKGKKLGKWTLPCHTYYYGQNITWKGKYRNGKKVGQWDIFFRDIDGCGDFVSNQQCGGGIYEKKGEEVKIGYWIELWDGFDFSHNVIFNDEYKSGKKVGRWNILHSFQGFSILLNIKLIIYQNISSGGGFYDDEGDEIKNGEQKNGKKIGLCDILFQDDQTQSWKQIGGGLYGERSEGTKHGRWIDLSEKFDKSYWVTFNGSYIKMIKKSADGIFGIGNGQQGIQD
ncbi:unnamed protein product [Paramecium octaurelia]|uniref:Uncharacterized protein n=1 Tax=Paramecium octaurelia TaxID=43137 RepID=A0A8S1WLT3_PAROT|nr:unnamed protein product [Paramecium octaurelia]